MTRASRPPADARADGDAGRWWRDSPCPHVVLDATATTVVAVNETFLAWSRHRREDVVGTEFARLLPVGDRILWSTHCLPALEVAGRVAEVCVQVVGADQRRHAALLTAVRSVGPDGSGHGGLVAVALFSAAERRRYEEELLEARRRAEASEARSARAEAGLQHLVHHDALTGLLNRSGLQAALHEALAAHAAGALAEQEDGAPAAPSPAPAVLFIDLDGFKAVNDSIGHAGGDELLTVVAERLRGAVRPEAVVARLAGDEFVVVVAVADPDEAVAVGRRLLEALATSVVIRGVEVVVSASIGIALAAGEPAAVLAGPGAAADLLLRHADAAMYQAKASGRSGWHLHDTAVPDAAADRLRLLEQLRHGIAQGELRLHYQPRVRLSDGSTTGVEALVRWAHPTRGLLPPAEFIAVAEQSGLVRELGAWVVDEAVAQAARWNSEGVPLVVGINLSTRQLTDADLLPRVAAALARHGVPASQLVLEITETSLMHDPESALVTLRALADLGAAVAVDDFGTGYASLTYLQRFPVHELKIDRSFVASLDADAGSRAIVAGCVQLARTMGLLSVAEGVETEAQHAALVALGCDVAQGYRFGVPVPASEVLLRHGASRRRREGAAPVAPSR